MYRIFIADDESWILERLVYNIDWNSIDAEVVRKAMDGKEALQKIREQQIDVLITDIRMPEVDGLELINEAKKYQSSMKSIIISGYSDFEYARKAISEGVSDYITKPVEDEELLQKVQKCCRELEEERRILTKARESQHIDKKSKEMLKEQYLGKLVSGVGAEDITDEELKRVGICDTFSNYVCLEIVFDNLVEDEELMLSLFVVENILIDLCAGFGVSYCVKLDSEFLMCVIGTMEHENLQEKFMEIAESLRKLVNQVLGVSISIGIGAIRSSLRLLQESGEGAKKALANRFFIGGNAVHSCEDKVVLPTKKNFGYQDVTHIVNYVKVGSEEKAIRECHYYVQRLKFSNPDIQPIDLKIIFQNFTFTLAGSCFNSESASRMIYNSDYFMMLHTIHDMESLEDAMAKNVRFLCGKVLMTGQDSKKLAIETVICYVKEHYSEKITLKDVAGLVYLNTSYFCKIFKEEMGESFVSYLIRYRMKKASEYLEDFSLMIYEVAELVGYNDMQYFTKLYKKMNGISPKEYRTNLIRKEE